MELKYVGSNVKIKEKALAFPLSSLGLALDG